MTPPDKSDMWQEPNVKRWVQHVLDDMVPKVGESALVCSLLPDDREGDVKFWVELGASICFDKPIVLVAFNDEQINGKLRAIADEIVVLEEGVSPESSDELAAAFKRLIGE